MSPSWMDRALVLAPHVDDETIGCGALLARLGNKAVVRVFGTSSYVTSIGEPVEVHTRHDELRHAMEILGVEDYGVLYEGAETRLASIGRSELVGTLDRLLAEVQPSSLFVALPSHHQDHQEAYAATVAALRMRPSLYGLHAVFAYEYPHTDLMPGFRLDAGFTYFDGTPYSARKREALRAHQTQLRPHPDRWLDVDLVMRWGEQRGREMGLPFAEKYYLLRAVLT